MSEIMERLKELKGVSDYVYSSGDPSKWAVSIDKNNFHQVCNYLGRDYEPAAVILKILENSRNARVINNLYLVGGSNREYDFCVDGGMPREMERALRDEDFFEDTINEGMKRRLVGVKLSIPGHGKLRVSFRKPSGTKEI